MSSSKNENLKKNINDVNLEKDLEKEINIESNAFMFNKLRNKLFDVTKENNKLKTEISSLKNKIVTLKADNVWQKHSINDLIKNQNDLLSLKNVITEKEKMIEQLKEKLINNHEKHVDELRYKESKYNYDLIQSQIQYESSKYKIDNYLKLENFNEILYKKVLEMEDIINNFNKIEESNLNKQKFLYMNKLNK